VKEEIRAASGDKNEYVKRVIEHAARE
jgi:hypothetical protein